jgi:hypothetical protein
MRFPAFVFGSIGLLATLGSALAEDPRRSLAERTLPAL